MSGAGSPAWRKVGRPKAMPVSPATPEPDTTDLEQMSPERLARHLSREALLRVAKIMRAPGRNAATQLRAAEKIMQYGVAEPAKAATLSAPDGGPVQSRHEIVFVSSEKK